MRAIPKRRPMHGLALVAVSMCLLGAMSDAAIGEDRALLLVSCGTGSLGEISLRDVRKAYLGLPIGKGGETIKPVRNETDERLHEIFLQRVMFMSAAVYERQVLANVFRFGGQQPRRVSKSAEVVEVLKDSPSAVTFMWSDALPTDGCVEPILELWRGSLE